MQNSVNFFSSINKIQNNDSVATDNSLQEYDNSDLVYDNHNFNQVTSSLANRNIRKTEQATAESTILNKESEQLTIEKSIIEQACKEKHPFLDIDFHGEYSCYLMFAIKNSFNKVQLQTSLNVRENIGYYDCYHDGYPSMYMEHLCNKLEKEPINYLLLAIIVELDITTIVTLLRNGIDPNTWSKAYNTNPLCQAIEDQNIEFIKILLKYKANPNIISPLHDYLETPLSRAMVQGNNEIFEILISYNANVNLEFNYNFQTYLVMSMYNNAFDTMELLLKAGANVNGCVTSDKNTPLYHAIMDDPSDTRAVKILLKYGANPNLRNKRSPLVHAIQRDAFDIMEILLEAGADINGCGASDEHTPLYYAIKDNSDDTTAVESLLKYGANPNAIVKRSPFLKAIRSDNIKAVALLLKSGAIVKAKYRCNNSRMTPLFYAVKQESSIGIVRLLLEYGAEANTEFDGQQAIELAIKNKNIDMAYLLRQYNAKASSRTIKKIVKVYGHDPRSLSLISDTALVIKKHYKLEDYPENIDKLPLPPRLKKDLKNNYI